jgi:carboxymethylenebutenolidase
MGAVIDFKRPDGSTTKGYLAQVAGKAKGNVVVIQEWWGLNDQICGIADRLARNGYNALAPDLYKGRVTTKPDEAGHLMEGLDFPGATHEDLRGAVQHLKKLGGKTAVMGYCMGGALTIAALVHVPEVDAGICYYGIPPAAFADPAKIRKPIQGHFANHDDWITPAAVDGLEKALKAGGAKHEIYRYDANHAFFNEVSEANYSAAHANKSWERSMAFLKANL